MAGQILKRSDGKWLVRVFLGRDSSGKRRYSNKPVHGTKKQAQKVLNKILRDLDTGSFVEPTRMTLDEYLDEWVESAAKTRVRPRTLQGYEELLKSYIRPQLGKLDVSRITPLEIQGVYAQMLDRGLSARTVRHAHGVLRLALNQAVRWRMIQQNPALLVDLPRPVKREMTALSPEQAALFLKHAAGNRWTALFALAITTGMRPGEYLGLQWKDVDLDCGSVTVRRALSIQKKGKWEFAEPKTPRSARTIPLPPSVTRALAEHKRKQSEERLKAGPKYAAHDLVFATAHGEPLNERNLVQRHFKEILTAAELPDSLRLYDLRHSCATLLLAQGEHPKVVSERLGHASVTLTLDTYSHVLPTMQQQAAERLEATLFGTAAKKRGRR